MTIHRLTAAVFMTLSCICRSQAQQVNSIVRGRILDPSGSPIPGARVTASSAPKLTDAETLSDATGNFILRVGSGSYRLTAAKPGFSDFTRNATLLAGMNDLGDIVLQLAPLRGTLTVIDAGPYLTARTSSATKTPTPLSEIPQSVTVVTQEQIQDQMMMSIADVVRYIPGITAIQGENNRDQLMIRGNSTSADFFVNGVRDDVQYYRDLYNVDRVEALKGPNALVFGRGGAGGVINRETKEADFADFTKLTLDGGSFGDRRAALDLNRALNSRLAFRLNGMYESSDSFREHVGLNRYGVSPALTIKAGPSTRVTLSYENFHDHRTADRGVPSYLGLPLEVPVSTYFGNPDASNVRALVNIGMATIEQQIGIWNIHNRTLIADYDRGYQNFVPGVVSADRTQDSLTAYNNATRRRNLFNQTDITTTRYTGSVRHTLLAGVELGRQFTDNFRNTGYFNNSATSILIPVSDPTISTPVVWRQSATDADNHLTTNLGAAYIQDQVELSRFVQLIGGIRWDYFDLQYRNNRTGDFLRRIDHLISPRAGIVLKPLRPLSIYGSYSVSYLPSSGDQFSSLTTVTDQVKPEKFTNYEAGIKWDASRYLQITAALYRLDRTNTRSTDPNDPSRIVQTGSQRTKGAEFGATGRITRAWSVAGGYARQNAHVISATTAAAAGAQVAQTPRNTFSLWNNYQVLKRLGVGLGIVNRSDMFAAIDDTVRLPGYTRADAAVFFSITEKIRLQTNVENLFDRKYWVNADSNTNISPGSPRAVRVGLAVRF